VETQLKDEEKRGESMSNTIEIMTRKLDQAEIAQQIRKMNSWFRGLIPPRSFEVVSFEDEFVPYILCEIWYRKYVKKWRRCFVFWNMDTDKRKGVYTIDNISYEEIEPSTALERIAYDEEAIRKEMKTYCLLQLFPKNYRKFIDWEIEIRDVKEIYRMRRTVRYKVNNRFRTYNIFLDRFALN
jgi:hypothetical protein